MFEARATRPTWLKGARALGVLVVVSLGAGACGTASLKATAAKAEFVTRVAETAARHVVSGGASSHPNVLATPANQPGTAAATAPHTTGTPAAPALTASAASSSSLSSSSSGSPAGSTGHATVSGTTATSGAPKKAAGIAPRTQPSVAQVDQAITAVNNLVPFFTPTPAQVAQVGNAVCTDFDHGETAAEVDSQALNMVGAGSYSWMIPSSVPAEAVATVVNLYCPGYASKLVS
jgi:hypothetical protein